MKDATNKNDNKKTNDVSGNLNGTVDFDEGNNTELRDQRKDKDVMGVDHVECEVTVEKRDKISNLGNGNSMNADLNMGKEDEISSLGKDISMDNITPPF
ncbi:hypothetical protein Tco_0195087 [Tanacetum coccineum]